MTYKFSKILLYLKFHLLSDNSNLIYLVILVILKFLHLVLEYLDTPKLLSLSSLVLSLVPWLVVSYNCSATATLMDKLVRKALQTLVSRVTGVVHSCKCLYSCNILPLPLIQRIQHRGPCWSLPLLKKIQRRG